MLARTLRMPPEVCAAWLDFTDRAWAVSNMRVLHEAGLTPEQGHDLYARVPSDTRAQMARLVDAGRMASLDTRYLHWWAASGLLHAERTTTRTSRGRPRHEVSFTKWVTAARRYIAATGGDQGLAALAAGAGLSPDETADRHAAGALDPDALEVLVALRETPPV